MPIPGLAPGGGGGAAQAGVSFTRDLGYALKGNFGNHILVLDRNELKTRFPVHPNQYGSSLGWEDEYEERVYADKIPASMVRGLIVNSKVTPREAAWIAAEYPFPVVYVTQTCFAG